MPYMLTFVKNLNDPALMQSKELYLKVLQWKKGGRKKRRNGEKEWWGTGGWPISSLSSSLTTHSLLINLKNFPWFSFPSFALPLALLFLYLISSFLVITFFSFYFSSSNSPFDIFILQSRAGTLSSVLSLWVTLFQDGRI